MTHGGEGITRREALRRGALGGLGLVWAAPSMERLALSAQHAQATSPVTTTTEAEETTTTPPEETTTTEPEVTNTTITGETTTTEGTPGREVAGTTVTVGDEVAGTVIEAETEVEAGQLPFTGFNAEHLLPIAGGLIATGAAAVRLAKERQAKQES